jgi:3-oxoadipate enol-lactonase
MKPVAAAASKPVAARLVRNMVFFALPLLLWQGAQGGSQWIEVNGVDLHYELSGQGTHTLVLLHEMGMTMQSWDELVPMLATDHRILRYDLRGFGLSEKIRGRIEFADEISDLRALLDALAIKDPVSLVGGAAGASIAAKFAADYPERVSALVLISPIMSGAARPTMPAAVGVDNSPAAVIERAGVRAYLDAQTESVFPTQLQTPERLARFRGMQLSSDPVGRVLTTRMISAADLSGDLSRIRCPTLILGTTLFAPGGSASRLVEWIAQSTYQPLPTGHFAALESPGLVLAALQPFLRQYGD